MSTLKERLDTIRTGFESKAPAEALSVMHRATADLSRARFSRRARRERLRFLASSAPARARWDIRSRGRSAGSGACRRRSMTLEVPPIAAA